MAQRLTLQEATATNRLFLFDTNVLFAAFKAQDDYGRRVERLMREETRPNRRFTTELVYWEFLHPNIPRDEMRSRRDWFGSLELGVRSDRSPGYLQTFMSMAALPHARGGPVDAALAATSIGSRGSYVIATGDADDFCWNDQIVVVLDFFRDPTACVQGAAP